MSGHEAVPPQMIDWSQLIAPVPPWAHLLACSERNTDTAIRRFRNSGPKRRRVALCVTHGDYSRTRMYFCNEWGKALQLHWRGRNWEHFYECIRDMDWMPAKSYVYVVTKANQLLISDNGALHTLIKLFASSADEWASYVEGGPAWPRNALFHVLFSVIRRRNRQRDNDWKRQGRTSKSLFCCTAAKSVLTGNTASLSAAR